MQELPLCKNIGMQEVVISPWNAVLQALFPSCLAGAADPALNGTRLVVEL